MPGFVQHVFAQSVPRGWSATYFRWHRIPFQVRSAHRDSPVNGLKAPKCEGWAPKCPKQRGIHGMGNRCTLAGPRRPWRGFSDSISMVTVLVIDLSVFSALSFFEFFWILKTCLDPVYCPLFVALTFLLRCVSPRDRSATAFFWSPDSLAMARSMLAAAFAGLSFWALSSLVFVNAPQGERRVSVAAAADAAEAPYAKPYGERDPLPEGYGIRTGLSDLLKPLNAEAGVVAKEDSIPTVIVLLTGLVGLFLFYWLLLLIDNQSVLLPPEDEFDEYVANFLPYFFFGEK